jgi:fatty acid kinase fatty acid binding subunit
VIGVITDSAASLDPGQAARHGIHVVPMQIQLNGVAKSEVEFAIDEVLAHLQQGSARTAGPSPGDFNRAIETADDGDGVVVCTVSGKLSSTLQSARVAARISGRCVEIVDTRTAAGAEGLVALAAAAAAKIGAPLGAVARQAAHVAKEVRLIAEVGDLSQLARSGRLPGPVASLGGAVGLRPVFELRRGAIRVVRPALSARGARELLLGTVRKSARPQHRLHLAGLHVQDPPTVRAFLDTLERELPVASSFTGQFSPVMVAHTGPDVRGLAWWWEPEPGSR